MLTLFWHRRDLRLDDNAGLFHSLKDSGASSSAVQPIFIFDTDILKKLKDVTDARVTFLHDQLQEMKAQYQAKGSDLWVFHGSPHEIFKDLIAKQKIGAIYCNHDYEPGAIKRDRKIEDLCKQNQIHFQSFKDQVIFEKDEIQTDAGNPYTVYTPYKNKWLKGLSPFYLKSYSNKKYERSLSQSRKSNALPSLANMGFQRNIKIEMPNRKITPGLLKRYAECRDFPARDATTHLGLALRFGTVSVREWARRGKEYSPTWLSELVWREFFMQILYHFPHVESASFRPEYDKIEWRQNKSEFQRWCNGETGFPIVDAGMRELNSTGYMHNRVRMITASFLTKQMLMHWLPGERYFAEKLLDYDLAANNGNWQWAASTGCDATPYFRIFNPEAQTERFDPQHEYIRKWVPELGTSRYPSPMLDHKEARDRALKAFAKALGEKKK